MTTFSPKEIIECVDDGGLHCDLPLLWNRFYDRASSGYPITHDFLKRINGHWFD
jgi:hypothetical protein